MSNKPLQISPAALGGYTIEGPYLRPSRLARAIERFFNWLGA